jgi:large subunit ribosomal protein L13
MEHAVRGMLPKNKLGRQLYRKLKVYAGPTPPHQAQVVGSTRVRAQPTRETVTTTTQATTETTEATEA